MGAEKEKAGRDAKGQFIKGVSGNEGGRPRVVKTIRELAQQHGPEAFERIVDLSRSKDERISLVACQEILNRAYGKPEQAHKLEGLEGMRAVVLIKDLRGGGGADG